MKKTLVTVFTVVLVAVTVVVAFAFDSLSDNNVNTDIAKGSAVQSEIAYEVKGAEAVSIDIGKAKEIVLTHTGAASDNAVFERAEIDRELSGKVYEIDFCADGYEYECEVDAYYGKVLKCEKEPCDSKHTEEHHTKEYHTQNHYAEEHHTDEYHAEEHYTEEHHTEAYHTEEHQTEIHHNEGHHGHKEHTSTECNYITTDEAKRIAVEDVGIKGDCAYIECEFDHDGGRAVYEIEIENGRYEYSYEINALTGAVIEKEIDIDD